MGCKKKWIIISVLIAAVVLLVGVFGTAAYAQTTNSDNNSGKTLLARVAAILGIDQQKLEDAFTQAQKEMQNDALSNRLKSLVDQGKLTQEQADQYQQWWQSRPNIPAQINSPGPVIHPGFGGHFPRLPGQHGPGKFPAPQATPSGT